MARDISLNHFGSGSLFFNNLYTAHAQAGSFRQTKTQIFCTCVGRNTRRCALSFSYWGVGSRGGREQGDKGDKGDKGNNYTQFPIPNSQFPISYSALTESRIARTVKATKVPSKAAPIAW
ncbi:hypothetical protein FBB35_03560 [Nostoc sp. TCL240-02]|nr:hypothetical protein FBB35_03560 [Nostoc sp. TCL240-02]